jgi:hypothetical protein
MQRTVNQLLVRRADSENNLGSVLLNPGPIMIISRGGGGLLSPHLLFSLVIFNLTI